MANRKISALTAILSGDISTADDYLPIVDASVVDADKNKRVTVAELGEAILAAGLTTDVSFTGNVTQTGTTAYAYKLARSGGGDKLRLRAEAAGGGGIINAVNSAEDDLEPLGLGGEHVVVEARVSAGATRQVLKVSDSGVTQYNSDGSRWHTWGHNADGVHWALSNNGDDFRWINSTGDIAMLLNATGTLVVGRAAASSNPLQLVANDATGDNYVSFLRDNASTVKGFIGYGNAGDDTFFISNDESPGTMTFRVAGTSITSFEFFTATSTRQVAIAHSANAVNYLTLGGNSTGNGPFIQANGSDTDVDLRFFTKGAAGHIFWTDSGNAQQLVVAHTASAVNYIQLSGAAAGGSPYFIATGSNANVGIDFGSRGTGGFTFYTRYNVSAKPQFQIGDAADTVNYLLVTGGATGNGVNVSATGSDSNIDMWLFTKGSGRFSFHTNASGSNEQVRITHTASAVNRIHLTGASTGNTPVLRVSSDTDTDVNLILSSQGSGSVLFFTGGASYGQLAVAHTANAVNYLQVSGSTTGNTPYLTVRGSDSNIGLTFSSYGTGSLHFKTDDFSAEQFRVAHTASAVNYVSVTGNTSSNPPVIRSSSGTDTNVGLIITSQGTGDLKFMSTGGSYEQVRIVHTANAVNYVEITGAPTGSGPYIFANGSDTNIDLKLFSKGSGSVRFLTNGDTEQARVAHTASAVNYLYMTGAATGGVPSISAIGSDTNIDLFLQGQGTGLIRFGTHTGSGDVAISGYITIRDAAGNTRKLAVIT